MAIESLGDIVRHHAREIPDNTAMIYATDGRQWTFRELDNESNLVAHALLADGIGAHERIAYLDKNTPEYFTYLYGGAKLNAVSVAVNWRLAVPEMEYILNNSEAKVLLVGDEFLDAVAKMNLTHVEHTVVIGDPGDSGFPTYDQWIAKQRTDDPDIPCAPLDTCYQLYTSGTTGLPKGVELTHDNFLGLLSEGMDVVGMNSSSVNLVCMPLFHIAGSGWGVLGQYNAAVTILLRDVELGEILRVIPEHQVTHSVFVPAVLQFLLATPGVEKVDYSSLKAILYGASPITEEVLVRAMEIFQCDFMQAYGLTETTGGCVILMPEDHDPGGPRAHLLRSCGKPMPGSEIKIVDAESLEAMPDGEVGEIWIRGRQIMKCYWKNEQATAETLVEGGWLRSGDIGYMREGYLYIHDRVKDMIISGGENIYPAEIENVLMKHPNIDDVAVIGVPSERWGEAVKAIITRNDDALTEQAAMEFCRENLAHYKCPTSVDWMQEIPRNPSGKILKTVLREPYWKDHQRRV
ncbi:MAG: long-chain-fatty-acid--CoA ligase [Gammaproteobacteria bacterium]|nr:long-chain-fatty-acid--CoA ligase [Gammaproteobacteria bacterium]